MTAEYIYTELRSLRTSLDAQRHYQPPIYSANPCLTLQPPPQRLFTISAQVRSEHAPLLSEL